MMYGLALSLKNEIVKIAPKGRVNCVAPGTLLFTDFDVLCSSVLPLHLPIELTSPLRGCRAEMTIGHYLINSHSA